MTCNFLDGPLGTKLYQQRDTDKFLYYYPPLLVCHGQDNQIECLTIKSNLSMQMWYIGNEPNVNMGFAYNRGTLSCPVHLGPIWEYWDWERDGWVMDPQAKMTCVSGAPAETSSSTPTTSPTTRPQQSTIAPPETCISGPACDACNIVAWHQDVIYCCSNNCMWGWIEIDDTQNPICSCGH